MTDVSRAPSAEREPAPLLYKENAMPYVTVKGMRCEHCKKSILDAVRKVNGVSEVQVDLSANLLSWTDADPASPAVMEDVKRAVRDMGFDV